MSDHPQTADRDTSANGFQLSEEPLVHLSRGAEAGEELPATYATDSLCTIARDPTSLFVYWNVNWRRLFDRTALSPRAVQLRVMRSDEIESTREINPFRGHCYVEVANAGADYFCELGCLEGEEWKTLLRSGTSATPRGTRSDDLSATFATLPIHLSFQRLLEIFEAGADESQLAHKVAQLQERESPTLSTIAPEEINVDALATLRPLAPPAVRALSPEVRERLWSQVTLEFGSASEGCLGGGS